MKEKNDYPKDKKQKENPEIQEQIIKLKEEIKQLKEEKEQFLYVIAEGENQKILNKKLNETVIKRVNERLIKKILTVLDSLKIATRYSDKSENPEIKNFHIGLQMILKQLEEVLSEEGLKKIKIVPLKDKYDIKIHKATKIEKDLKHPDKIILKEEKEGYFFRENVLREAEVTVNKTD